MFKNMKTGVRLGLGFGVVLLLLLSVIWVGLSRLESLNKLTDKIVTKDWTKAALANDALSMVNDNARANMELLLVSDKEQRLKILERIDHNKGKITATLEKLEGLLYLAEGKALMEKVKEKRRPYVASFAKIAQLVEKNDRAAATRVVEAQLLPALREFIGAI